MLQLLLHFLYISLSCLMWGLPALLYLRGNKAVMGLWAEGGWGQLCFLYFAGLITLSVTGSWLVLLMPLNAQVSFALLILICCWTIYRRKHLQPLLYDLFASCKRNRSLPALLAFISGVLLILVLGSLHPVNEDTKTYYVQLVRWTNEQGTVPGLANLFPRLGLGSNWLNLVGLFEWPFTYRNFTWLNAATAVWFLGWLVLQWQQHLRHAAAQPVSRILGFFFLLVIFFTLYEWDIFRDGASSPNVDFIVTALTIIVLTSLLKALVNGHPVSGLYNTPLLIACLAIVGFKFSGMFMVLIPLILLVSTRNWRHWLAAALAALMMIAPVLIRNYLTSGYPLFPMTWQVGHPDWQLPASMTRQLYDYILVTNRYFNAHPDLLKLDELVHGNWLEYWWQGLMFRQKLALIAALAPAGWLVYGLWKKRVNRGTAYLFLLIYLMLAGWFMTAPAPRFGMGMIAVLACWVPAWVAARFIPAKIQPILLLLYMTGLLVYTAGKSAPIVREPGLLIHTVSFDRPPVRDTKYGEQVFHVPEIIEGRWMRDCFDTPLPCLPVENPYLETRGRSLSDGFRMREPDTSFVRHYVY